LEHSRCICSQDIVQWAVSIIQTVKAGSWLTEFMRQKHQCKVMPVH